MKLNRYIELYIVLLCFSLLSCAAVAEDITQFQQKQPNGVVRYTQPIMSPDKVKGDGQVFNPTVIQVGNKLAMIYRRNGSGTTPGRGVNSPSATMAGRLFPTPATRCWPRVCNTITTGAKTRA